MRKKVKTFFHVFTKSLLPQPEYYRKIIKTGFFFSFKYFLSLLVLIYFVSVFSIFMKFNPVKIIYWKTYLTANLNRYPDDLVINVENGSLMTTYNRPYFLWADNYDKKKLLLVIDQMALPDKIYEYRSSFLLTGDSLVVRKNDRLTVVPLKNLSFRIDKELLVNASGSISTGLLLITFSIFILFLVLVFPLIIFLANLLYLLIISFFVLIGLKIVSRKISYKKILQLSFHSSTIPLIISCCLYRLHPFCLSFLILLFLSAAVYETYIDRPHAKIRQ